MKFTNQTFEDQDVPLDGNEYIKCTFTRCKIIFGGVGSHTLDGPTFNQCNWHFDGAAGNTLAFLAALYHWGEHGQRLAETILAAVKKGNVPAVIH